VNNVVQVQDIPSVHLVDQYRDLVMLYSKDTTNNELARKIQMFEQEIIRRMAWG
jgi:hypothetical protein